jgi:hypothetical protein
MVARYVERLMTGGGESGVSMQTLREYGYVK